MARPIRVKKVGARRVKSQAQIIAAQRAKNIRAGRVGLPILFPDIPDPMGEQVQIRKIMKDRVSAPKGEF